jgi:hypothetical protein
MAVHGDPPDKCNHQHYTRFLVNSPLQVKLTAAGELDPSCSGVMEQQEKQILHCSCLANRWRESVFILRL